MEFRYISHILEAITDNRMKIDPYCHICQRRNCSPLCTFQRCIDCVDIARRYSARGRQTTVRWQKQVFIHTRLSRAYLALARLSCNPLTPTVAVQLLTFLGQMQCMLFSVYCSQNTISRQNGSWLFIYQHPLPINIF